MPQLPCGYIRRAKTNSVLSLVVGGQREIVVLLARVLAERHLKRAQNARGGEPESQKKNPPGAHTTMLTSHAR